MTSQMGQADRDEAIKEAHDRMREGVALLGKATGTDFSYLMPEEK